MLLALLLHLVLFHLLSARDKPPLDAPRKDSQYEVQRVDSCPSVGYTFRRQQRHNSLDPGDCFLCFCQEDHTAVCWKRENRRCDKESFHYHGVGKRDTRIRRSPSFADIFFRDASRDIFGKNVEPECKPFESSFSDDCPPTDWCIGCTVCDCDSNGRWDCHLLSFCPDEKDKQKSKRKGSMRKLVGKKPVKHKKALSTNPPKKTISNPVKNNKTMSKAKNRTIPIKREGSKTAPPKRIVKKSVPIRMDMTPEPGGKRRTPIRYKRIPPSKSEQTKEKIIKRNIATHKPIEIKSTKVNLEMEIAQKLMRRVMENLKRSIKSEVKDMSKIAKENVDKAKNMNNAKKPVPKGKEKPKTVNKRQIKKPNKKPPQKKPKPKKPMKKPIYNPKAKPTRKPTVTQYSRQKRDVSRESHILTLTKPKVPGYLTTVSDEQLAGDNTTTALSIIPMATNLLVTEEANYTRPARHSTLPGNEYYRYVVGGEDSKVGMDTPAGETGTTQVNMTETVFDLIDGHPTTTVPTEITEIIYTIPPVIRYEVNKTVVNITKLHDLKFSKWSHLKRFKDKKNNSSSDKHKNFGKLVTHTNFNQSKGKERIHGKNVARKINGKKFNVVKLLRHPKCKMDACFNDNSSSTQAGSKNIGDLHGILTQILKSMDTNTTTVTQTLHRRRKFSILRYLKRIFNKIFKRNKTPNRLSKHQLIETLCENFGPCIVSRRDKMILNGKLADIDIESTNILKTVRIIKGLLKLVQLPKNAGSKTVKQENFRNDIQKLNHILKGGYNKNDQTDLTTAQQIQIDYIKKNTQEFIKSVSKFASLLNEIIMILTKQDVNIPIIASTGNDIKNTTKDDPFENLKDLLIRYNLIQNTFMKRMYEQLNNFENKVTEKPKVSEFKDVNNSVAIENFSRDIIQNLRKLKRFAQTVSSSYRAKRATARDDDAIEYLLMLMEYLIKQNHPLDAAPVNDGIDLLIEAIKNAPDIKPIKKKVLEYTPTPYVDTTTAPPFRSYTTESFLTEEDSPSESEKSSSEDSGRIKLEDTEGKLEAQKDIVEMVADDEKYPYHREDKYHYDRRAEPDKIEDITDAVYYNRVEGNMGPDQENLYETTTPLAVNSELGDKLDSHDDVNAEKTLAIENNIENNILDKPLVEVENNEKKFEVFVGDMDDEVIPSSTTPVAEVLLSTTTTESYMQSKPKPKNKMRHLDLDSFDSESIDKKSKLEWIEENFGKGYVKTKESEERHTTTAATTTAKIIVTPAPDKGDVSSLTREERLDDNDKNSKKNKINAEEVMLRKQMDLLNSLDYGTEKGEVFGSDSKDGINEERYASDNFPSYFV
nr:uncharacterized protein LOC110376649 [Helicoverpa armigera]